MYGYISGITETDDINYCPKCGSDDLDRFFDGTAKCCDCGFKFGVVEVDISEDLSFSNFNTLRESLYKFGTLKEQKNGHT